jgi:dihydrofolate reductase
MSGMKIFVYIGTSLDGFIARMNGDIDWLVQFANEEAIQSYQEFISGIDAVVIGRGTFETVLGFPEWPYDKPVFVVSTSMSELPEAIENKATILSLDPKAVVMQLTIQGFSNIYVDGGKLIQSFLKADLVDELIISKAPILIGSGRALFSEMQQELVFNHTLTMVQSNGLVRSYYVRKR